MVMIVFGVEKLLLTTNPNCGEAPPVNFALDPLGNRFSPAVDRSVT